MSEAGFRDLTQTFLHRSEKPETEAAGWAEQRGDVCVASKQQPPTFEVEDSEFLCRRRRGC